MFVKNKSQVIKFDQNLCKADADNNSIFFIRVTDEVKSSDACFEVPPTHNAIVIKGGGDLVFYPSGRYDIFESKKELKNWKKGMSIEIIYIAKETSVKVYWGTKKRILFRDEASGKIINVGAYGQFEITVDNPIKFYKKVVGFKKEFDVEAFKTRFSEIVINEFTDLFLRVVAEQKLTYDKFNSNKKAIAERIGEILAEEFKEDYGISLSKFLIEDINLFEEEREAIENAALEVQKQERLKEYLAELERLDDKKWEREKYLRQLELQDKNAYYQVLKVIGTSQQDDKETEKPKPNICPNCKFENKEGARFCSNCGYKLIQETIICQDCGAINEPGALFCSECGKKLVKE